MSLLLLVLIPLILGLGLLIAKPEKSLQIGILGSLIELGLAIYLIYGNGNTHAIDYPWIPDAGIRFKMMIDGINSPLILLATLIFPFILATICNSERNKDGNYVGLLMIMQSLMIGAFLSFDAFLFYFFFEAALIPIYFIIIQYGEGNKNKIALKFFVYTLFGSLFLLIGLIYIYLRGSNLSPSSDFLYLYETAQKLSPTEQNFLLFAFFIAFAIKMPIFPFHTWQPDTYTSSPAQGTMMLSGIMLKMGTYGVIRLVLPMFGPALENYGNILIILSIIGVIYGSIIAIQQTDAKKILAYSSFAHVGLISAGMLTNDPEGVQGAIYQMVSHGINVVGLFFIVDIIEKRTKTRNIYQLGGITQYSYVLSVGFIILSLGSVGLPLTNGFIGEFILLKNIFEYSNLLGIIGGLTIILAAVYSLRLIQKTIFGNTSKLTKDFPDLNIQEKMVLVSLSVLVILGGIFPHFIFNLTESGIENISKWFIN